MLNNEKLIFSNNMSIITFNHLDIIKIPIQLKFEKAIMSPEVFLYLIFNNFYKI